MSNKRVHEYSVPVSYTHLDVYKRQAKNGDMAFSPTTFIAVPRASADASLTV